MFDFSLIFRSLVDHADGRPLTIASAYPLPTRFIESFRTIGGFSGWIADAPPASSTLDRLTAGWWTDRNRGRWHLMPSSGGQLALIGAQPGDTVGGHMQLEALLNGYDKILLINGQGQLVDVIDCFDSVARQIDGTTTGNRYAEFSYDRALDAMWDELEATMRVAPIDLVPERALLIVGSLGPGGAERQVAYTAIGLAKRGLDVCVGCNHLAPPGDFFKADVEEAGVKVVQVPSISEEFETPAMLDIRTRLARYDYLMINWGIMYVIYQYALLIREVRPSLVHTWMDYSSALGGLAAQLVGVPGLVMGGRSLAPDNFPMLYQPYMQPCYRKLLARCPVELVNNSAAGARDYERWLNLPAGAIDVVPNGFDFPETSSRSGRSEVRKRYGIAPDALVVGTISRLSEEKNPHLFVDMARAVVDHKPNTRFLIFGQGPLAGALNDHIASAGLSGIVHLCGLTPSPWPALAAMDVSVLTSRAEGLSNVLIESQAAGLPIVCTGVGGMPETYLEGETGFGVPAATGPALAAVVLNILLDDDLRTKLGRAAYNHARSTFANEAMIERTSMAYRKALARTTALQPIAAA